MYNTKQKAKDISMSELTRTHIEKKNTRKMVYDNIYKQCCEKIRYMNSQWHKTCCSFIVPSIQMGMPIYKMETCIVYLMYKLKQKGFYLEFLYPNKLNISWKHALIRELKNNDGEWHKITQGKLYGNGNEGNEGNEQRDNIDSFNAIAPLSRAPLSQLASTNQQQAIFGTQQYISVDGPSNRWDHNTNNLNNPTNQLQRVESIRNQQSQTFQRTSSMALPPRGMVGGPSVRPPPPLDARTHSRSSHIPAPILISTSGSAEDARDRDRSRKRTTKKRNEERYRNEQNRIAEVVRRKNNEAMRALNFSTSDTDKTHKKVLKIKS
jgi:hypothetical protein